MNSIQEFYVFLDQSYFDQSDVGEVTLLLEELAKKLVEKNDESKAQLANLEREGFLINKSFDQKAELDNGKIDGLSWQMSGTYTLKSGEEAPFYWPDIVKYDEEKFKYFEERYNSCKNLFAKVEYGLLVYFGKKTRYSKHRDFKLELGELLFTLCKQYLGKAADDQASKGYFLYFFHTLKLAFQIAKREKFQSLLKEIVLFTFSAHLTWNVSKEGTLRILLDLSDLMSEEFKTFKDWIDFDAVILKNLQGAIELEKAQVWGAIYAINTCIEIQQKKGGGSQDLILKKARLYEKLANEGEGTRNMAALSFVEDALVLYKQINSELDIERLEIKYSQLRGKIEMGRFAKELPQEEVEAIQKQIHNTVSASNEQDIISFFIQSPWYASVEKSTELAKDLAKKSVLLSMIPASIMDKFGNTIEKFSSDQEKEELNFWTSYGFQFQMGTQTMFDFFMEAITAKKLTYKSVLVHLEKTWMNESITREYYGAKVKVIPLDILKPPLKYLFAEMEDYRLDHKNFPDLLTSTDSLTLKIEGLVRFFVERLGLPTFKFRPKGKDVVMEKLLDDLLADIKDRPLSKPDQVTNFDEDDRILIKYVMTEKAGLNLRNKVAHGLLDFNEYSLGNLIVLFCIILKLSKYKFVPIQKNKVYDSYR
ncbi:DUF4209 domain-containing protein [Algoriphagus aquimarinus]|uniref:DUF4209 domain-containing protein n=1 Tax=Algoriphagus aquimarinus TaxID=237018 RepID=A0A5C7AMP5_9BACT|nr:DUF4209 domain-containing protein [Algoriphagus aquimarinus]TXE08843.1 DUF4209 domain-containing protein [Algoriphagus aquimarinus]